MYFACTFTDLLDMERNSGNRTLREDLRGADDLCLILYVYAYEHQSIHENKRSILKVNSLNQVVSGIRLRSLSLMPNHPTSLALISKCKRIVGDGGTCL